MTSPTPHVPSVAAPTTAHPTIARGSLTYQTPARPARRTVETPSSVESADVTPPGARANEATVTSTPTPTPPPTPTPTMPRVSRLTGPRPLSRALLLSAVAIAGGLVVGGITSFGQLLPGTLNWLANSVAGWSIPLILLVAWARGGVLRSAITGGLVFVAMSQGYALVSTLRGYPDQGIRWALIGLVAGPVLGAATALLRNESRRIVAIAAGVLGGVILGDAVHGFVAIPAGWGSWVIVASGALAFLAVTAVVLLRAWRPTLLLVATAAVVASAYSLLLDPLLGLVFR
ncbi:DUF6518 family protein [Okibacterium fritillariae]|nr:DUF6518 family protein [Okibacterium fritillariae]